MQITYQKNDGSIIQRERNTMLPYKIGETTSMGWKVLNIEYEYKNKFYSQYEYNVLLNKNKQKYIKKKQVKEIYINRLRTLMYYCAAVIIVNLLKYILGI